MTRPRTPATAPGRKDLPLLLDEFRTALESEIDAAKRATALAAVSLVNGRKIDQRGESYQYVFAVESPLNLPDDSPADLVVPGRSDPTQVTIVSLEGLLITVSAPIDLGGFVPKAKLQSDLTYLLRSLIRRIEDLAERENPAGLPKMRKEISSVDLARLRARFK